jgi:hypothetical protein
VDDCIFVKPVERHPPCAGIEEGCTVCAQALPGVRADHEYVVDLGASWGWGFKTPRGSTVDRRQNTPASTSTRCGGGCGSSRPSCPRWKSACRSGSSAHSLLRDSWQRSGAKPCTSRSASSTSAYWYPRSLWRWALNRIRVTRNRRSTGTVRSAPLMRWPSWAGRS